MVSEVRRCVPAVLGTFAAHLRTAFAMVVVVVTAHFLTGVAGGRAQFKRGAQDGFVAAGPTGGDAVGRGADIRAVHAVAHAIQAILDIGLGQTGVGAGIAERSAVHGMAHGLG